MITSSIRAAVQALASDLRSSLAEASPIPWGDARSTYRLALADGRVYAARQLTGPNASKRAEELAQRFDRLAMSGIATARPVELRSIGEGGTWLLTPWIDGMVGAAALQDPSSAVRLANGMGRLSRQIAGVDSDGLDIGRQWAGRERLAASAAAWLARLETGLARETRLSARRSLDQVIAAWDEGAPWRIGTSHGDFAPINVIVGPGDSLVVLDLDDLQRGPRLLDVAWWGWVVRYHHPAAWAAAWPTLVSAAGLDGRGSLETAATTVGRLRVVERAATSPDPPTRSMWLRRLEQTADW